MTAIYLLVFLHIEATWLLKFSRSSSNLQVVEGSINVPSTEKLIFSSSVWLCLGLVLLKISDSHFLGFSRRPLSVIQLGTTANSEFRVFCTILAFAFAFALLKFLPLEQRKAFYNAMIKQTML